MREASIKRRTSGGLRGFGGPESGPNHSILKELNPVAKECVRFSEALRVGKGIG